MSADNWAICPQCLDGATAARDERLRAAADAYGQVPPEEYLSLLAEAETPVEAETFRTFREDYDIDGARDGTIVASYKGRCQVCNIHAEFRDAHPFYGAAS